MSVRLPADTSPPATPVVSVTDVGPTHVSLAWSSSDDGPNVWFWVFKDGSPISQGNAGTSGAIYLLEPETTYTFTVQARDFGMNWSPPSEPLIVTTGPSNAGDVTPPTAPANLAEDHWGDGKIALRWDPSADDLDPQSILRYDVYVNGVLSDIAVGRTRSIVYGVDGLNTIAVVAVDTAGNASAPATLTLSLDL